MIHVIKDSIINYAGIFDVILYFTDQGDTNKCWVKNINWHIILKNIAKCYPLGILLF